MLKNNSTNFPKQLTENILNYSNDNEKGLFEYQNIVSQYMLNEDIKGMILYHTVGTGKTLTAIHIAEQFRKLENMDVIVISPKSLKDNFVTTLQKYLYNNKNNKNTGEEKLNTSNEIINEEKLETQDEIILSDDQKEILKEEIIDSFDGLVDNIIEENIKKGGIKKNNEPKQLTYFDKILQKYSFITYGGPNMIKEMLKSSVKEEKYNENKFLYNKVIIVDEAHSLFNSITNGANIATQFYELVMRSKKIKLLFLTGTPIVNNFFEIVPAFNMCKGYISDKVATYEFKNNKGNNINQYTILPESYDDFVNLFVDDKTNKVKNTDKFRNRIYGLISYYGPFYFDQHIPFQKQIQISRDQEHFPTLLPIKFVKVNMSHDQNVAYLTARTKEKLETVNSIAMFKKFGKGNNPHHHSHHGEENHSIIMNEINCTVEGGAIQKNKSMGSSSYRIKSRQISNIYIEEPEKSNLIIKSAKDLSKELPDNLEISPKMQAIINNCLKHKNQLGIIYSNFLKYGLLSMAKFLDNSEYKGKYALFTGDVDIDIRNNLVKSYNDPNNTHGEQIELLLVSSTGEKGLNLKRVRHIHIMEPNWSYSTTDQIIGRGVRYKSHIDLPSNEQNVQVYEYMSDYEKEYLETHKSLEYTTDLELFYKSVKNKEINDDFLKILASTSIECPKFNKYKNFECFMCDADNKVLYLPDINDDMKIDNPCKKVKLYEVIIDKNTFYYDKDFNIYKKNNYDFYVKENDVDIKIINKIKKLHKD